MAEKNITNDIQQKIKDVFRTYHGDARGAWITFRCNLDAEDTKQFIEEHQLQPNDAWNQFEPTDTMSIFIGINNKMEFDGQKTFPFTDNALYINHTGGFLSPYHWSSQNPKTNNSAAMRAFTNDCVDIALSVLQEDYPDKTIAEIAELEGIKTLEKEVNAPQKQKADYDADGYRAISGSEFALLYNHNCGNTEKLTVGTYEDMMQILGRGNKLISVKLPLDASKPKIYLETYTEGNPLEYKEVTNKALFQDTLRIAQEKNIRWQSVATIQRFAEHAAEFGVDEKQEKTQQRFFSPEQEERILSAIYTEHVIGENLLNTLYGKDRAFYDDISKQDGGGDPRTLEGAVNRLYQNKYDDYKKSIELRSQLELPDLHKLVYEHAEIDVNGHKRTCEHGLQQGFINAVKSNDALHKRNAQLEKENQQLREQLARNKPSKELEFEF